MCKVLDGDEQSQVYTLQKRQPRYPRATGFRWMTYVWARSGVWASKGIFSAKSKGAANCCMGESLGEVLFHEFKATLAT